MADHPYKSGPDRNFWRRAVAAPASADVDPVGEFMLKIRPDTKVATAGSCFAQHIARHLKKSGFDYFVAEPGHPILPLKVREAHNYGLYSARYGNIYTAMQLSQLMQRAYGHFHPKDDCWKQGEDVYLDPFRPSVQPGGFISELEMRVDREQHLACVRQMFENLDVFIFTFGLTECWVSAVDDAAYPICPGVEGGEFDPARYVFRNETVDNVVGEMSDFLAMLGRINPQAQVILTVSPVPLVATARRDQHVLAATTYSKSVLRVAAETLTSRFQNVHYFPAYEIITGTFNRGAYFADDLRNVVETGVAHVMSLFMKHATSSEAAAETIIAAPLDSASEKLDAEVEEMQRKAQEVVEVECDEVALDRE